mmetsp:Transcript_28030/g.24764  ORF Transcript_28030/g.24764 Transcript_28030/m.24764 type:complete len:91 (-) Transcript_28030:579-851(-)
MEALPTAQETDDIKVQQNGLELFGQEVDTCMKINHGIVGSSTIRPDNFQNKIGLNLDEFLVIDYNGQYTDSLNKLLHLKLNIQDIDVTVG